MLPNRRFGLAAAPIFRVSGFQERDRWSGRRNADRQSIRDLAYSIIRVLDRDGKAIGPWGGLLSDEELRGAGLIHQPPRGRS